MLNRFCLDWKTSNCIDIVLHYIANYITLHYITLHCIALHCIENYITLHCKLHKLYPGIKTKSISSGSCRGRQKKRTMSSNNSILSNTRSFNVKNIMFSEPQVVSIPDSDLRFKRINLQVKNPDGTIGDIVLRTEELFSFGVAEETSRETGKVSGYKMPLCCWNRDGPTKDEKAFTDLLQKIAEACKDHLLAVKDDLEKYDLERSDMKKICSALYWKMERGVIVEGQGPTLYAKLVHYRKDNKFGTKFFAPNGGADIEPLDLIGKRCNATAAIKIDNIYVGRDVRLQIKILEAEVTVQSSGAQSYLRPQTSNRLLSIAPTTASPADMMNDSDDDGNGSLDDGSDDEDEAVLPVKKTIKVPRKRRVKKDKVKSKA